MSTHKPSTKQGAHERAKNKDLRDFFKAGETIEVIIQTSPENNGGEEAVAIISRGEAHDARVFITPGNNKLDRGDRVRCRIYYVDSSYIKAHTTYKID